MKRRAKIVILLGWAMAAGIAMADAGPRYGLPWDWSHRARIHNPDTLAEAMAKGEYDAWLRKSADPRFMSQLIRKMDAQAAIEADAADAAADSLAKARGDRRDRRERRRGRAAGNEIHRDWSNVMGGAGGVGVKATFPAKYGFDINAAPSCANDFVVYTTNASGAAGTATTFATRTGTFTGNPGVGTVTITNGTRVLTLTRSTTQNLGLFFQTAGSNTARATNLANAIARNGGTVGVTATSALAVVTVSAITVGAGSNAITTVEGISNFTWSGGTLAGGAGTAGQPTIIAFNQLYASCGTTPTQAVPTTFWSYNTGAAAFTETSPVLSLDGTQVVFIERTGTNANLVMLKWSSTTSVGTVGAPTAPTLAGSGAAYRSCAAPCMFKISLGANNTRSSPYYYYDLDELYVGAANGTLHKFTGIFIGNPAAAGAPWPVTVSTGNELSSPVYDDDTGLVFVGSARSTTTGGQLHSVNAGGTVVSSGQLAGNPGGAASTGVADSPFVDSTAQRVYAFVASDTNATPGVCGGVECQAIFQFPTSSSIAGLTTPRQQIGRGQKPNRFLRGGAFDNGYWASTPTSPTGFLYMCGALSDGSDTDRPTLWRIPVTANVMGAAVVGPRLTANNLDSEECSPITEVMNGANDFLFVSVPTDGNQTGCAGSCIYMFNLTGITWNAAAVATAGLAAPGGTGGIIIDNISAAGGASQIYYSTMTNPGNAIQASQAALN